MFFDFSPVLNDLVPLFQALDVFQYVTSKAEYPLIFLDDNPFIPEEEIFKVVNLITIMKSSIQLILVSLFKTNFGFGTITSTSSKKSTVTF